MKHVSIFVIILLGTQCSCEETHGPSSDRLSPSDGIVGLWMMGQSLCDGSESLPIVTPTDSGWGNYRFRRGVRTWIQGDHSAKPGNRPEDQFRFVPLTATRYGGLGETIANGLADHLTASANKEPPVFLTAYAGQGGRFIDELSSLDQSTDSRTPKLRQSGGGYYRTSLDDARRARAQATAMDKTFAIRALIWMQGEANGGPTGGINPNRWDDEIPRPAGQHWYRDRLIHFRRQWSHDLQQITGQTHEIPLFTYQTLGPAGEAQLMAADLDPHITMVGPHYMVASAANSRYAGRHGDPIHMSADGERWYGEQVAKVVRRVLSGGEDWQPLRPRKTELAADRTSIVVDFQVPRPPLVLDETFLPRQQYSAKQGFRSLNGFQVRDAAGAVAAITAVEVASPTQIRIRLASSAKADAKYTVSYGQPYAGRVGTITSIRKGPVVNDQPTTELLVDRSLDKGQRPLLAEGAFYVANVHSKDAYTRAPIRHVAKDGATTVLRFEDRELRNNVCFEVGQRLTAQRGFSFGNLRDSDPEQGIYRFADSNYGTRAGQAYPLWNWCVLFSRFPVTAQ